jgi:hypothetical protein
MIAMRMPVRAGLALRLAVGGAEPVPAGVSAQVGTEKPRGVSEDASAAPGAAAASPYYYPACGPPCTPRCP